MKFLSRLLILLLVAALCAGGYAFYEARDFLETPAQSVDEERFFDVEPGATMRSAAAALEKQGLVRNARYFVWLARWKQAGGRLQAGRFALRTGWTPEQVLNHLVYGRPALSRLTLREGLTWWQTGKLLEEAGYLTFADFTATITDPEFLRHYGIPFSSAEGFLMPETYLLKRPDKPDAASARATVGRLVDTFWRKTARLWPSGAKPGRDELRRVLTLASIVERETAVPQERPRVAGVYMNRLRANMPLQADPTVIYGLGPGFDGNLRRRDLNDAGNPYNTYQHPGLPPGPICSPGVSAIAAALAPEQHEFLYFVAITDGGRHAFSRTLDEHNRAVRAYLNSRKKASAAGQADGNRQQ